MAEINVRRAALVLAVLALGGAAWSGPRPEVAKAMEAYRAALPAERDLAIYRLDWAPSLKEAKARAAREGRPVLLLVVTNSYGNLYTGHC